jgi:tight adherence protein C
MDQYLIYFAEAIAFAVAAAIGFAGVRGIEAYIKVQRRLGGETARAAPKQRGASPLLKRQNVKNPFLRWVQSATSGSESDVKDRQKLRRNLSLIGIESPAAPVVFVVIRFSLAIGLPLLFLLAQKFSAKPAAGAQLIVMALALCGLGLVAPGMYVTNRVNARKLKIEHEFPDALDLMVVCVESGLGLEAAIMRVGQEVHESHPLISDEFSRVSEQLRAGRGRGDALRSMAERTDVATVKSFVALMIQTDTLGTSIGRTLKSYSIEMRADRFLKAEEKAMRIPVLMTIPLVACILPVIITALLLPPILDVMRTLAPAMNGRH